MITANSPNLLDLSGRKILITGAAGGIGSATAQLCAQHGARLVLIDIVSRKRRPNASGTPVVTPRSTAST
jgi:NAD(P)-dependent dehydrogenase (short-subunit alcohol dehydrogenase family)